MDDQPPTVGNENSTIVDEAAALIAARTGTDVADAVRALRADAAAFDLLVAEVAEDVVNIARASGYAKPTTIASLLATARPAPDPAVGPHDYVDAESAPTKAP